MIDTKQLIKAGEEKMTFAIEYLDEQLSHIRAGKANPKILDCVKVMYYGAPVPLTTDTGAIRHKRSYYIWQDTMRTRLYLRHDRCICARSIP